MCQLILLDFRQTGKTAYPSEDDHVVIGVIACDSHQPCSREDSQHDDNTPYRVQSPCFDQSRFKRADYHCCNMVDQKYRGECNEVVGIRGWKLSERYKESRKSNGRALSQLHPPLDSCKRRAASSVVMPIPSASLCYKKKKCDLRTLIIKHHLLSSFNNRGHAASSS